MPYQQQIQHKHSYKVIQTNRRKAIRERCLNCSAWFYSGVKDCQFEGQCPLWPFRSGQGRQDAAKRSAAIKAYCRWCVNGSGRAVGRCADRSCPLFPYRKDRIDWSANIPSMAN